MCFGVPPAGFIATGFVDVDSSLVEILIFFVDLVSLDISLFPGGEAALCFISVEVFAFFVGGEAPLCFISVDVFAFFGGGEAPLDLFS